MAEETTPKFGFSTIEKNGTIVQRIHALGVILTLPLGMECSFFLDNHMTTNGKNELEFVNLPSNISSSKAVTVDEQMERGYERNHSEEENIKESIRSGNMPVLQKGLKIYLTYEEGAVGKIDPEKVIVLTKK